MKPKLRLFVVKCNRSEDKRGGETEQAGRARRYKGIKEGGKKDGERGAKARK